MPIHTVQISVVQGLVNIPNYIRIKKFVHTKFQIEGKDIPIVHRVLTLHEKEDGSIKALTKGEFEFFELFFSVLN